MSEKKRNIGADAKFHILLAIDSLLERGSEKVTLELGEAFLQLGHRVSIIIYEKIVKLNVDPRIMVFAIDPAKRIHPRIFSRLTDNKNVTIFKEKLNQVEIERGYVNLILSALPRMDRILSRIKDNRIFHVIHSPLSIQSGIQGNKWHKKISRIWHIKRIYDNRQIVCVSEDVKNDLLKYVRVRPASIQVIHNPFNFKKIKWLASQSAKSDTKQLPKKYIIHVGTFTIRVKRQDLLIKAFAQSKLRCKLVLLGKGKDEKEIYALIKKYSLNKRIVLPGFQVNPYPWIKHASLLVVSSRYEGFGNVLIEAMSLGVPVLSTNCGGPNEILSSSMRNSLVPNGNVKMLAKKMNVFYYNPPQIYKKTFQRFEANHIAKEYLKLIPEE
jgi:glycosyltransferase involved in cell wall biosynthesis